MARPTALTQELLDTAGNYLDEYENLNEVVPSLAGLSKFIGASRSSVFLWKSTEGGIFDLFSDVCSEIMEAQEIKLLNGGLSGDYAPTITKLMMTKHGYTDKQEIQQEVKQTKELSDFYGDS